MTIEGFDESMPACSIPRPHSCKLRRSPPAVALSLDDRLLPLNFHYLNLPSMRLHTIESVRQRLAFPESNSRSISTGVILF
ncbi:hypothetical protein AAHA92_02178 [Salvia divinorum]|uniref:Uncharacterized protein n=1 Tax=Salvia divinorum TaxID=28513 RepID=A0ABD1IFJ7_SALDI